MKKRTRRLIVICGILISLAVHQIQAQNLDQRVDSILKLMTTAEKLLQLENNSFMTTPDNNRLGIPGFVMDDGPHGVRFNSASAFPTGIAMAATFDKDMLWKIGKAMGEEFWAFGKYQQLGPCIDISLDPRGGRTAESAGEDPYISGQVAKALILGIQTTPVIATVKHFMIEGKQAYRNTCNEIFSQRDLMEHFGYNFRTALQDGGAMSIMSSYNLINGVQVTSNKLLLDTILRQRWGFPFYVVSDWGAVHDSKLAVTAGNDICMGSDNYKNDLPGLVANGQVSMFIIDKAVRNVLRTKIMAGLLDYYPKGNMSLVNSSEHKSICLEGARKSIVLLKNSDNILPLKKSIVNKIAIIGPNADRGNLNCFGSSETTPVYSVSVKQGLINKLGSTKVTYLKGCDINSTSTAGFQAAKDLAAQCDYVIFAGGLDETQEGEAYDIGNDRKSKSTVLPGKQIDLINALAEVNKNIIVVIQSGGVCSMHNCIDSIKGLIYSFYAGQEAGNAIADVLFGDYNPAGRIPVTMPTDDSQLPTWNDNYTDDYGTGYRWFDEKKIMPEFAFGFGLSYSNFLYSNLKLSSVSTPAGSTITISVDVQNVSQITGEEVVELYLSNKSSSLWMPPKELKGYERITLESGEKKTVTFVLDAESFQFWNVNSKQYEVGAGNYTVNIGGSSDNLVSSADFELTATDAKPDLKVTQIYTIPRFPLKGQKVTFYALVKNLGTAAITANNKFSLSFSIDNVEVASAKDISVSINPEQVILLTATNNNWTPSNTGLSIASATIDNTSQIDEWNETNNTFSRPIEVYPVPVDPSIKNVAYKKNVWVSSVENNDPNLAGSMMLDGLTSSRWSSQASDQQFFVVDLGTKTNFKALAFNWEAAYALQYKIAISNDSVSWDTIASINNGHAGLDTIKIDTSARYIKFIGLKRGTIYGYSLYEFEVLSGKEPFNILLPVANAGNDATIVLPTNCAELDGCASADPAGKSLSYLWLQLSGPNTATISNEQTAIATASNLIEGEYVFKLSVSNNTDTNSTITNIKVISKTIESIPVLITSKNLSDIKVFPNPAKSEIHLKLNNPNSFVVAITDITGRRVYTNTIHNSSDYTINVSNLKQGIYILTINNNAETVSKKIIIQ